MEGSTKPTNDSPSDAQESKRQLILFAGLADEILTRMSECARRTEQRIRTLLDPPLNADHSWRDLRARGDDQMWRARVLAKQTEEVVSDSKRLRAFRYTMKLRAIAAPEGFC
jgi:hypothetical protein